MKAEVSATTCVLHDVFCFIKDELFGFRPRWSSEVQERHAHMRVHHDGVEAEVARLPSSRWHTWRAANPHSLTASASYVFRSLSANTAGPTHQVTGPARAGAPLCDMHSCGSLLMAHLGYSVFIVMQMQTSVQSGSASATTNSRYCKPHRPIPRSPALSGPALCAHRTAAEKRMQALARCCCAGSGVRPHSVDPST